MRGRPVSGYMGRVKITLVAIIVAAGAATGASAAPSPPAAVSAEPGGDTANQSRRGCRRGRLKVVFRRRGRDPVHCVRVGRRPSEARGERSFAATTAAARLWSSRRKRTIAARLGRSRLRRVVGFEGSLLRSAQRAEAALPDFDDAGGAKGSRRLRTRAPRGFSLRRASVSRSVKSGSGGAKSLGTKTSARLRARRRGRAAAAEGPPEYQFTQSENVGGPVCPDDLGYAEAKGSVVIERSYDDTEQVAKLDFKVSALVGVDGRLPKEYDLEWRLHLGAGDGGRIPVGGRRGGIGSARVPFGKPLDPKRMSALWPGISSKAERDAYAKLSYQAFIRAQAAAERQLREAEDHFYDAAGCNTAVVNPAGVVLPSLDVLMESLKNKRKPGAERKHDWTVTNRAKGKVGVTPTNAKSIKGVPVKAKVFKSGTNRVRASAPAGAARPRAGTRPIGTIEVEAVSRLGRAVTTVPVAEQVPDQYFRVSFEVGDDFGWTRTYESLVSPGTDSECRTSASGNGTRSAAVKSKPGSEQLVVVSGDAISGTGSASVGATFTQLGTFGGSRTGPNCSGSFGNPTSGCGTKAADGSAELSAAGAGRARVSVSGPEPFDQLFDDCPITWPGNRIDGQGNLIEDDVHPFIAVERVPIALPVAQLNDPSKPSVVVNGSRSASATQFCSAAGLQQRRRVRPGGERQDHRQQGRQLEAHLQTGPAPVVLPR